MMMYRLDPEVAGEIGENSEIIYENGMIKDILHLHYEMMGWLGDELLTQTPCFLVSEALADSLLNSTLSGYQLEKVEVTKSEEFQDLYPNKNLPNFLRLLPLGKVKLNNQIIIEWSGDDFCLDDDIELVVSKDALLIIKKHMIDNCDIKELHS